MIRRRSKFYLILLLLLVSKLSFPQNTTFEVRIEDDSLNISPVEFLFDDEIDKYIGLVQETNIYPNINSVYPTNSLLYTIDNGDTISHDFSKIDTSVYYYNITTINIGEHGFLLSGVCKPNTINGSYKTIFTRINDNFEVVWERIMQLENNYNNLSMRTMQLKDSSFLYVWSPQQSGKMLFQNISYSGDSLRQIKVVGESAGDVWSITYNHDSSGYIVYNRWGFYQEGSASCSMIEYDENFIYRRHNFYEGFVIPELDAVLLPNGNILTSGHIKRIINDSTTLEYIGVYIYDHNLNLLYKRKLTDPNIKCKPGVYAVDYSCPSCIYVAGTDNFQSFGGSEPDWYYLTKLDDTLGIEFEKYIGGDSYYWLRYATVSSNGAILLSGYTTEIGAPLFHNDAYFVELDSLGCITGTNINKGDISIKEILIYPNPGSNVINIRTALKGCVFHLYDNWGRPILSRPLLNNITSISTNTISKGNYYYTVNIKEKTIISGIWIKN